MTLQVFADREKTEKDYKDLKVVYDRAVTRVNELKKENDETKQDFEMLLKILKTNGILKEWYYNGRFHYTFND